MDDGEGDDRDDHLRDPGDEKEDGNEEEHPGRLPAEVLGVCCIWSGGVAAPVTFWNC